MALTRWNTIRKQGAFAKQLDKKKQRRISSQQQGKAGGDTSNILPCPLFHPERTNRQQSEALSREISVQSCSWDNGKQCVKTPGCKVVQKGGKICKHPGRQVRRTAFLTADPWKKIRSSRKKRHEKMPWKIQKVRSEI